MIVATWVFISSFPFIQARFVFLFKLLRVDSVCAILGLGDLQAGSLPTSSTSSTSLSSLCSLSSCCFSSSGSLAQHVLFLFHLIYKLSFFILKVSTWVFISFFPFIQAHFVFLFKLLRVDGVHAILGLGDLRAGSLPASSTMSMSSSSLCSLPSCSFSSSGSLFSVR